MEIKKYIHGNMLQWTLHIQLHSPHSVPKKELKMCTFTHTLKY